MIRHGSYIWRRGTTRRAHRDVERVSGRGGTTIVRVGPNFGDVNTDKPEPDPTPALQSELAAQRRAREQ